MDSEIERMITARHRLRVLRRLFVLTVTVCLICFYRRWGVEQYRQSTLTSRSTVETEHETFGAAIEL